MRPGWCWVAAGCSGVPAGLRHHPAALYMPLIMMLLALVFLASPSRCASRPTRHLAAWWDRAFWWGSTVAAFWQGIALGAFVQGIEVATTRMPEGGGMVVGVLAPDGVALVAGYGLLGPAGWCGRPKASCSFGRANLAPHPRLGDDGVRGARQPGDALPAPAFRARWFGFPEILCRIAGPVLVVSARLPFIVALMNMDEMRSGADDRA